MTTQAETVSPRMVAFAIPLATTVLGLLIAILINWCNLGRIFEVF